MGTARTAVTEIRWPGVPQLLQQTPGGGGDVVPVADRYAVAGPARRVRSVADGMEAAASADATGTWIGWSRSSRRSCGCINMAPTLGVVAARLPARMVSYEPADHGMCHPPRPGPAFPRKQRRWPKSSERSRPGSKRAWSPPCSPSRATRAGSRRARGCRRPESRAFGTCRSGLEIAEPSTATRIG